MGVQLFTNETAPAFGERIERIGPGTKPLWGSMDATQLMRHLSRSFEISLGEVEVQDQSTWFSRNILWYLFFYAFTTWPKGIKAPEVFTPAPVGDFEKEKQTLLDSMKRFLIALEHEPGRKEISPFMGPTSLRDFSRIHGVHLAHHLRQFGV